MIKVEAVKKEGLLALELHRVRPSERIFLAYYGLLHVIFLTFLAVNGHHNNSQASSTRVKAGTELRGYALLIWPLLLAP